MQTIGRCGLLSWLCGMALLTGPGPALGQAIDWLGDYDEARLRAAQQDRPLLLTISSAACAGCARLHAGTFPDPHVAGSVSRQFVALKMDTEQHASLVQALRIEVFPTVIFASPGGTILHVIQGYVDAEEMSRHIDQALARLAEKRTQTRSAPEAGPVTPTSSPYGPRSVQPVQNTSPYPYPASPAWSASPPAWGTSTYGHWTNAQQPWHYSPRLASFPDYFPIPRRC
jgi:hypothetical protein